MATGRLAVLVRFGGAAWLLGLLGLVAGHAQPGAVLAGVALALADLDRAAGRRADRPGGRRP